MFHDVRQLRPGSDGEHDELQERLGSADRARTRYDRQVLDHLDPRMREFVMRQEMFFIVTADARGECDSSLRAGDPGVVQVLDERTVIYPEYRANGVGAGLGNISENGHIGLMFIDVFRDVIGLHINGSATIVEHEDLLADERTTPRILTELDRRGGGRPERWVMVSVHEAYVHCSKQIPAHEESDGQIAWAPTTSSARAGTSSG